MKEYIKTEMAEFVEKPTSSTLCSKTQGQSTRYQVQVAILIRKTVNLEVDGSDTVEQIKEKIQNETGIQLSDEQQLQFKNKKIETGRKISEYEIQNGSTLHMIDNLKTKAIKVKYTKSLKYF